MLLVINKKDLKTLKYHTFSRKKTLVRSIISSNCGSEDENMFKEEGESINISKIVDLNMNIEEYQNKYDWRKHRPKL